MPVTTRWTKNQTGEYAEALSEQILRERFGIAAQSTNIKRNNAAFDLIGVARGGERIAIEVKGGLVSNKLGSQQWRATIGQPGKAEKKESKALSRMTPKQKRQHNRAKAQAIMDRKNKLAVDLNTQRKMTITHIINPDTGVSDVYLFDGFHLRIGWTSELAREHYIGSFRFVP